MFNKNHFYHQTIRRLVSVFGTMFNDIYVIHEDSAGNMKDQLKVPLAYGPKQKFLARLQESPDLRNTSLAIKLPRMSFEITSMAYDTTRQLPKTSNFSMAGADNNNRKKAYVAAPYTIGIQLSILTKTQDDGLQIIEQIIPYFQPSYTVTVKNIPGLSDIKSDVPITLTSVAMSDEYEGDFTSRRAIIYTLDFDVKINFFGPVDEEKAVIRTAITNISETGTTTAVVNTTTTTNPIDAGVDDAYGYTETINFLDEE